MDSRDGLPRGALPSGILKMRKKCQGLKIACSKKKISYLDFTQRVSRKTVLLIKILRVLVEKSQFSTSKNEFERHGIIFSASRWFIWPFLSSTEKEWRQLYIKSTLRGHLLLGNWTIGFKQQDGIFYKRKAIKNEIFARFENSENKKSENFPRLEYMRWVLYKFT